MYAILDENNVCIGILENANAAVREAKKLGAKCVKQVDNVSTIGSMADCNMWEKSDVVIKNHIGGLAIILF